MFFPEGTMEKVRLSDEYTIDWDDYYNFIVNNEGLNFNWPHKITDEDYLEFKVLLENRQNEIGNEIILETKKEGSENIPPHKAVPIDESNEKNVQVIICHFCDKEIPISYMDSHINSESHKLWMNLTDIVLKRMDSHIKAKNLQRTVPTGDYCEDCASIVTAEKHEESFDHFDFIQQNLVLKKLLKILNKKEKTRDFKFGEVKIETKNLIGLYDTLEHGKEVIKVSKTEKSLKEEFKFKEAKVETNIRTKLIVEPKCDQKVLKELNTENIENQISKKAPRKRARKRNIISVIPPTLSKVGGKILSTDNLDGSNINIIISRYFDMLKQRYSLANDITVINDDLIEISLENIKLKSTVDNYHSFCKMHGPFLCKICRFSFVDKDKHILHEKHIKNIASVINSSGIRQLCELNQHHCIVCNEITLTPEFHVLLNTHISRINKAIIKSDLKAIEHSNLSESSNLLISKPPNVDIKTESDKTISKPMKASNLPKSTSYASALLNVDHEIKPDKALVSTSSIAKVSKPKSQINKCEPTSSKLVENPNLSKPKKKLQLQYCESCNVNIETDKYIEHTLGIFHRHNYQAQTNKRLATNKSTVECMYCNKFINKSEEDAHAKSDTHLIAFDRTLSIHKISVKNDSFYCDRCKIIMHISWIKGHLDSHKMKIDEFEIKALDNHDSHCYICDTDVPKNGFEIHIDGKKHKQNIDIKIKQNKCEKNQAFTPQEQSKSIQNQIFQGTVQGRPTSTHGLPQITLKPCEPIQKQTKLTQKQPNKTQELSNENHNFFKQHKELVNTHKDVFIPNMTNKSRNTITELVESTVVNPIIKQNVPKYEQIKVLSAPLYDTFVTIQKKTEPTQLPIATQVLADATEKLPQVIQEAFESTQILPETTHVQLEKTQVPTKTIQEPPQVTQKPSVSTLTLPETTHVLLEATHLLPDATQELPQGIQELSKLTQILPQVIRELSKSTQILSQITQEVSESTQILPETAQVLPEATPVLPEATQELPQVIQELSKSTQTLSQVIQELYKSTQILPQIIQKVSKSTKILPKTTQVLLEATQVVPEAAQELPQVIQDLSESTQMLPKSTHVLLEATNLLPESTQELPQVIQELSEPTQELPQAIQEQFESTQILPDTTHMLLEATQVLPEITQELPQIIQKLSKSTQILPDSTQGLLETTKVLPEPTQELPEVIQELSEPTQELPQVIQELSESTQVLPQAIQEQSKSTQILPKTTHVLLEATQVLPEATQLPQVIQELYKSTQTLSQVIQEVYESTQILPQLFENLSESTQILSETTQVLLEATQVLPEAAQELPRIIQELYKSTQTLSQVIRELSD